MVYRIPAVNLVGRGCLAQLKDEIGTLGCKKALVVSDKFLTENGVVEKVTKVLDQVGIEHTLYNDVKQNPSVANVEGGLEVLKKESAIMNNLSPSLIKIKEQKKRWGSCTSNKIIYINSRISMAPIDVIDYILVHEFCHLVHMNHSKDFYNLVGEILPKFRENERWLKENSYKLSL